MFDFEGARAQGFSDEEIVNEVKGSGQYNYKFDQAMSDGVKPAEIVDFLSKNPDRFIGGQQTMEGTKGVPMEAVPGMAQPEPTPQQVNIIPTPADLDTERANRRAQVQVEEQQREAEQKQIKITEQNFEQLKAMSPQQWKEMGLTAKDVIENNLVDLGVLGGIATLGSGTSMIRKELVETYGMAPGEYTDQEINDIQAWESIDTKMELLSLPIASVGPAIIEKAFNKMATKIRLPENVRNKFASWTTETYEQQQHMFKFMEANKILPSDSLLLSREGDDLAQFLGKENVFATKNLIASQTKLNTATIGYISDTLKALDKAGIDIKNITSYTDILKAEEVIKTGVKGLRAQYKAAENEAFGAVTEIARGMKDQYKVDGFTTKLIKTMIDNGAPAESISTVEKILKRFSKPYKDETGRLKELNKTIGKTSFDLGAARKQLEAAMETNDKRRGLTAQTKVDKLELKLSNLKEEANSLNDVKYMTAEDLMNTIKLINRKIYVPGGNISRNDAQEISALMKAKSQIEDLMKANVKNEDFWKAREYANNITKRRAGLFPMSSQTEDKVMLSNILQTGELSKIKNYMTGPNAKENILYLGDALGKDSDAFKQSLHMYLFDKLQMNPEQIQNILQQKRAVPIEGEMNVQAMAANLQKLDAIDYKLIEDTLGKQAKIEMQSIKQLVSNAAATEDAMKKYGIGISGGITNYIRSGDQTRSATGRAGKVLKDAIGQFISSSMAKIVHNQPYTRTVTGGAVGATYYFANEKPEDISLAGFITSTVLGAGGGYYGGKLTRSLLENDATKIARYLKEGRFKPGSVPKDFRDTLIRVEDSIPKEPSSMREALFGKSNNKNVTEDIVDVQNQ